MRRSLFDYIETIVQIVPEVVTMGFGFTVEQHCDVRLDIIFEEGALVDVSAETKGLLTELGEGAGKSGIEVRWFRYSAGGKFAIPIP
jgi:hypothetical protein